MAVCSFDKRGVGGSEGRWEEAAVPEQVDDVMAALAALGEVPALDAPSDSSVTARAAGWW